MNVSEINSINPTIRALYRIFPGPSLCCWKVQSTVSATATWADHCSGLSSHQPARHGRARAAVSYLSLTRFRFPMVDPVLRGAGAECVTTAHHSPPQIGKLGRGRGHSSSEMKLQTTVQKDPIVSQ